MEEVNSIRGIGLEIGLATTAALLVFHRLQPSLGCVSLLSTTMMLHLPTARWLCSKELDLGESVQTLVEVTAFPLIGLQLGALAWSLSLCRRGAFKTLCRPSQVLVGIGLTFATTECFVVKGKLLLLDSS